MRIKTKIGAAAAAASSIIYTTTTTITTTTNNILEFTSPAGDDIGDAPGAVDVGRQHDRPAGRPRRRHGRRDRRRSN